MYAASTGFGTTFYKWKRNFGEITGRSKSSPTRENTIASSESASKLKPHKLNRALILISACLLRRTTEANGRVPTVDVQPLS